MKEHEFSRLMNQLTIIFSIGTRNEDELFEAYSKYFLQMDSLIFGKAIDLLIETYPNKTIPTPREISVAVAEIKRDMPREQHYGEECPKCLGMGLWIDKADGLAKVCDCKTGQTRKANLTAYDTAHPQFKRNREYAERSRRFLEDLGELKKVREDME